MKLIGFKKSSEGTYYFGRYPHLYFEVVESADPLYKEICETEIVKAGDFAKIVENVFLDCLSEVAVMKENEGSIITLEPRPFLPPFVPSGKLCIEILPYGGSQYADLPCLSMEPPQYIQVRNVFIIAKSYDAELIKRIADLVHAVYDTGTLDNKNVQEKALKLFLFEEKTEPVKWNVGYIPTKDISKKTIHLYLKRIPDSITVDYALYLSYVIFTAFGKLYIGNLPTRYIVNPGESEEITEEKFDVITVRNVNSFNVK
jgi:hypothetical protein